MAIDDQLPPELLGSVTGKPRTAAERKITKEKAPATRKSLEKAAEDVSPQSKLLNEAKNKFIQEFLGGAQEWVKGHERGNTGAGLGLENIVGVSAGQKYKNGTATPVMSVRVMVRKKATLARVNPAFRIPKTISIAGHEIPTDVVEVGNIVPQTSKKN